MEPATYLTAVHLIFSQVKLRPSPVDLREAHAACMKLSAGTLELAPQGQEAALAAHSLTDMLSRDPASQHTDKRIVLVTDRLFNAEDFKAYLAARLSLETFLRLFPSQIQP